MAVYALGAFSDHRDVVSIRVMTHRQCYECWMKGAMVSLSSKHFWTAVLPVGTEFDVVERSVNGLTSSGELVQSPRDGSRLFMKVASLEGTTDHPGADVVNSILVNACDAESAWTTRIVSVDRCSIRKVVEGLRYRAQTVQNDAAVRWVALGYEAVAGHELGGRANPLRGVPYDRMVVYFAEFASRLIDLSVRLQFTHNDLHTGNVMLTDSGLKMIDLGRAQCWPRILHDCFESGVLGDVPKVARAAVGTLETQWDAFRNHRRLEWVPQSQVFWVADLITVSLNCLRALRLAHAEMRELLDKVAFMTFDRSGNVNGISLGRPSTLLMRVRRAPRELHCFLPACVLHGIVIQRNRRRWSVTDDIHRLQYRSSNMFTADGGDAIVRTWARGGFARYSAAIEQAFAQFASVLEGGGSVVASPWATIEASMSSVTESRAEPAVRSSGVLARVDGMSVGKHLDTGDRTVVRSIAHVIDLCHRDATTRDVRDVVRGMREGEGTADDGEEEVDDDAGGEDTSGRDESVMGGRRVDIFPQSLAEAAASRSQRELNESADVASLDTADAADTTRTIARRETSQNAQIAPWRGGAQNSPMPMAVVAMAMSLTVLLTITTSASCFT